jgi:hypothetical protein
VPIFTSRTVVANQYRPCNAISRTARPLVEALDLDILPTKQLDQQRL